MSVRCQTYALHLTLTASWPPTHSGELFNFKHPDYRPVYAERAVRLARIRTPSGSCQPCAPICLKLPFTTDSSGVNSGSTGRPATFRKNPPTQLRIIRVLHFTESAQTKSYCSPPTILDSAPLRQNI